MDCSVPDAQDRVISTGPSTFTSSDTVDRTLTDSERSTALQATRAQDMGRKNPHAVVLGQERAEGRP